MSLVRAYDIFAAIFCLSWFAYFTRIDLSHGGSVSIELVLWTSLAYWGRRSRVWAAALGGGGALGDAYMSGVWAYQRQLEEEKNLDALIADNPMGDAEVMIQLWLVGAVLSGIVSLCAREFFREQKPIDSANLPTPGRDGPAI